MTAPVWVAIIALIAACVGPLIAYISANKKLSGKIGTSEAESLWAESASIREDYRARLDQANKRINALEERNTELERSHSKLVGEIAARDQIIDTVKEANDELIKQMSVLHTQLKMLRS